MGGEERHVDPCAGRHVTSFEQPSGLFAESSGVVRGGRQHNVRYPNPVSASFAITAGWPACAWAISGAVDLFELVARQVVFANDLFEELDATAILMLRVEADDT